MKTVLLISIFAAMLTLSYGIKCYQCASSQDMPGDDNCGAYKKFDTNRNKAVECNSEQSFMPGSFCMKVTQQGPRGFIWDGRWRQVIRRCASVAEAGVTGVCNWGVYENGVYWEECYCGQDSCNSSDHIKTSFFLPFLLLSFLHLYNVFH